MRIEIAGASVTEQIAEVLETLQTDPVHLLEFNDAVNNITQRLMTADPMGESDIADLQQLHRMLAMVKTIAADPSLLEEVSDTLHFSNNNINNH